jgi:hypothetical protein
VSEPEASYDSRDIASGSPVDSLPVKLRDRPWLTAVAHCDYRAGVFVYRRLGPPWTLRDYQAVRILEAAGWSVDLDCREGGYGVPLVVCSKAPESPRSV